MTSKPHSREAKATLNRLVTGLIAVKSHLNEPYPDDPRWTPWERFVAKELRDHEEALDGLFEQLETCERDRAQECVWRTDSEARERGLREQFETLRNALTEILERPHGELDEHEMRSVAHAALDRVSNPASEPEAS